MVAFFIFVFVFLELTLQGLKFYILIFLLIIVSCNNNKNNKTISSRQQDSLSIYLGLANDESINLQKRQLYNKRAFNIIDTEKNDSLTRANYYKVANRYFNMNDLENYKLVTRLVILKSLDVKDSISLVKGYEYMVDYFSKNLNSDSAYYYNFKSEKIYRQLKNNSKIAKSLMNKAILQHNESDYLGAERTIFDALIYLKKTGNNEMLYEAYNLLGLIFSELAEYKLSEKYYNEAAKIINSSGFLAEYHLQAITYNNFGLLYSKQGNYSKALNYYSLGLDQKNLRLERPNIYATLIDNLAYSKLKVGKLSDLPKLFYESLRIRDSIKIVPEIILSKIHLSEFYELKKDSLNAKKFALEAYQLADLHNDKRDMLTALKQLSSVEPKNASKYSKKFYIIDDSLELAEHKTRNKFARIEYETEELVVKTTKLEERQKTLIYTGLGLLVIGIFIYVIRFQAAKNRELRLVQEQQQANEEIYQLMINQQNKIEEVRQLEKKRIAQELHDGVLGKLFGTRMHLGMLNEREDKNANTERVVFIEELQTLEQEIREISHDLNSEKTAVFNNFVVMVTNFIETQKNICKATISFSIDPKIEWNKVDNIAKINFYRILQEAFQNINKYANAQNVTVTFQKNDDSLILTIKDDGAGFVNSRKKKGIGLQNMESRIQSSGGTLHIESAPQQGTLLQFELPLEENA